MNQPTPASVFFDRLRAAVLASDDSTARQIIRDLAEAPKTETEWVEWKEANGLENGKALGRDDKKNLAKCLSAFANSAGGLIVWGVTDDRRYKPFTEYQDHLRHQMKLVGSATLPPISGVDAIAVRSDSGSPAGFVVTYVPRSEGAPHQVSLGVDGQSIYYGRFGSECQPLNHYAISDLFGRRPGPVFKFSEKFSAEWKWVPRTPDAFPDDGHHVVELAIVVSVANNGSASAHNAYCTVVWPQNRRESKIVDGVKFDLNWWPSVVGRVLSPSAGEQRSVNANALSMWFPSPLYAGHMIERLLTLNLRSQCKALPWPKNNKAWMSKALLGFVARQSAEYQICSDGAQMAKAETRWTEETLLDALPEKCNSD